MGGSASSGRRAVTGINVTPLVDITLVLLIVFMVTAKLIVRSEALRVDLPHAAAGEAVPRVFEVQVFPGGEAKIDDHPVSDDELQARARSAVASDHEVRAVVQADGAVPHRRVMRVLDLLKGAGVSRVGFGVAPHVESVAAAPPER